MPTKTRADAERAAGHWARPIDRLATSVTPPGAINLNLDGRRPAGALQGFGQMWQKTYRVRLSGKRVSPQEVVRTWKRSFPDLWPRGSRFYAPLTGIAPGEVGLINLPAPGGMRLSTGIRVIYADDESFTFMTPEGHMLAGWITFSAHQTEDGVTIAQAQVLIRANDPLWELIMRVFGYRQEDEFWHHTLQRLAGEYDVSGQVLQETVCVDPKVQWSYVGNLRHNAAIRSALYTPIALLARTFRREA
jgi:hypothetical protein